MKTSTQSSPPPSEHNHHRPPDHDNLSGLSGHWLLARMGKRVLRPGGREFTQKLLQSLSIEPNDNVVEFAPGLGATVQSALSYNPASYVAIERDPAAAAQVQKLLSAPNQTCVVGDAANSGLPSSCASVVYGEAMLTMHSVQKKTMIAKEAFRLLRKGGRYGIHEIAIVPNHIDTQTRQEMIQSLASSIRVGARPQTVEEWHNILQTAGFTVRSCQLAPMHLLELGRIIDDEGVWRTLRFLFNVLRTPQARQRIFQMRQTFRRYQGHLSAIILVADKP